MSDAIIVGLIAAIASVIAAILTSGATQRKNQEDNLDTYKKMQQELREQNAVQNVKIDHLTEEVQKHNNFAQKIPVLEERIKVANNRLTDLERKVG